MTPLPMGVVACAALATPTSAPPCDGVRDARSPICPQSTLPRSSNMASSLAEFTINEDRLNVYSLALKPARGAPVDAAPPGFERISYSLDRYPRLLATPQP